MSYPVSLRMQNQSNFSGMNVFKTIEHIVIVAQGMWLQGMLGQGREKSVAALMALKKKPIVNETVIIRLNRDLTLLNTRYWQKDPSPPGVTGNGGSIIQCSYRGPFYLIHASFWFCQIWQRDLISI